MVTDGKASPAFEADTTFCVLTHFGHVLLDVLEGIYGAYKNKISFQLVETEFYPVKRDGELTIKDCFLAPDYSYFPGLANYAIAYFTSSNGCLLSPLECDLEYLSDLRFSSDTVTHRWR